MIIPRERIIGRQMDRLTSLTVFARVVECGGFSAAARRLDMSATMVSNHIQSLEDRLGARLLNRTTRKTGLTEIGQAYYERCTQVLADLEEADRVAGALQSTPRGTLRLYVGTHIVRFVAPAVAEFLALYPEASVDLSMGERMVDLLGEGVDLAIRPTPPPELGADRSQPRPLAACPLRLAGLSRAAWHTVASRGARRPQLSALRVLPLWRRVAVYLACGSAGVGAHCRQSAHQQCRDDADRRPWRTGSVLGPELHCRGGPTRRRSGRDPR